MNQDERYQQQYDDILDAVMKNMLISNSDSCFDDIPSEEEIKQSHSFSPEFLRDMEVLLQKNQTPKRTREYPARIEAEQSIEEPDQSFWEEWKQRHQTANGSFAGGRRKLRPSAKAAIAAAAVFAVVIGSVHLSDNGFLRASRTQNVVEYGGQSTLLTDMMDGDYNLIFKKPSFIPKEYKLLYDHKYDYMRMLEYSNGTKTLTIKYDILSNTNTSLDSERHAQEEESIRLNQKYDAMLSFSGQSDAYTTLVWQDGFIQYRVLGYESEKTLIQIAESIIP